MTRGAIVHSLASGSSGNSFLVRTPKTSILIDAGISCRRLQSAVLGLGLNPSDVNAILITHEHGDHTCGALLFARKFQAPLVGAASTLSAVTSKTRARCTVLEPGEGMSFDDIRVESFPTPHDAVRPVGYSLYHGHHKIFCATDTGHVTDAIRREAKEADLLIMESNHDIDRLMSGPYPAALKHRILGANGHLSNDAAAGLAVERASQESPATIWLSHLSKTNNTPNLALKCVKSALEKAGLDRVSVEVALRDNPSVSWRAEDTAFQISLAI